MLFLTPDNDFAGTEQVYDKSLAFAFLNVFLVVAYG